MTIYWHMAVQNASGKTVWVWGNKKSPEVLGFRGFRIPPLFLDRYVAARARVLIHDCAGGTWPAQTLLGGLDVQ